MLQLTYVSHTRRLQLLPRGAVYAGVIPSLCPPVRLGLLVSHVKNSSHFS